MFKWLKRGGQANKENVNVAPNNGKSHESEVQRTEKFIELAAVLSDGDSEFLDIVNLYAQNKTADFSEKFQRLMDESGFDFEYSDIEDVVACGLVCFGYMGSNDWKFALDDFLFNSKKAFEHYGIDMSVYDDIPNQDEIAAPEAFKLIADRLPDGFGLGMWDFLDDSYELIVSRKSTLEKAEMLGKELNVPISSDCLKP